VAIDVQNNDNDPDFDQLSTGIVSQPLYGTATLNGRLIMYQPNAGFTGTDSFTYIICDNGVPSLCNNARVIITVQPLPPGGGTSNHLLCKGSSQMIGSPAVAGNSYIWSPAAGLSNVFDAQPTAAPSVSTLYTLSIVNNATGCRDTARVMMVVQALPLAAVGPNRSIIVGTSVQIGAAPVSGSVYTWSNGESLNSNKVSMPKASPVVSTTYSLTELDTLSGCSKTNEVLVSVIQIEFFNGFSPNGDGSNDFWNIPVLELYPDNEVIIVNRWGAEVWKTVSYNNTNNYWNGQNLNGKDLPDGTYYYIIRYNGEQKDGWVIIKR
jgi:gliding motility-associated-like protein